MPDIDPSLVTVGQPVEGGGCYASFAAAPTYPTSATEDMSTLADYESVGELSDAGFTEGKNVTTSTHKGWHGTTLLATTDDSTDTYQAALVEVDRGTAAKLRYGAANVTVNETTGAITQINNGKVNDDEVSLVFEELESNGYLRRTVVKRCKVTRFDDVPHQRGNLMVYGMTFTVLEPADGSTPVPIYRAEPVAEG